MENCLVKKLKRSVSNHNLNKLGHVVLDLISMSNKFVPVRCTPNRSIEIALLSGQIESAQGDATFIDSTHAIINGNSVNTGVFTVNSNEQIKADISNYYDLSDDLPILATDVNVGEIQYAANAKRIMINPKERFNIATISEATQLEEIEFLSEGAGNLYGDLSYISNFTGLKLFALSYVPVGTSINVAPSMFSGLTSLENLVLDSNKEDSFVGNITDFGALTNLTTLRLQGNNISGTVESFVAAQIAAGRATCSGIAIGANMGYNVTFQGAAITDYNAKTLSWTSASNITIA